MTVRFTFAAFLTLSCVPLQAGPIDFTGHGVVYRPETEDVRFIVRFNGDPADLLNLDQNGNLVNAFNFFVLSPTTYDAVVFGALLHQSTPNIWVRDPQQPVGEQAWGRTVAEVPYRLTDDAVEFFVPLEALTEFHPDGVFPYDFETYRDDRLLFHVRGESQIGVPEPSSLSLLFIGALTLQYLRKRAKRRFA
jgi:hypothetical protein